MGKNAKKKKKQLTTTTPPPRSLSTPPNLSLKP